MFFLAEPFVEVLISTLVTVLGSGAVFRWLYDRAKRLDYRIRPGRRVQAEDGGTIANDRETVAPVDQRWTVEIVNSGKKSVSSSDLSNPPVFVFTSDNVSVVGISGDSDVDVSAVNAKTYRVDFNALKAGEDIAIDFSVTGDTEPPAVEEGSSTQAGSGPTHGGVRLLIFRLSRSTTALVRQYLIASLFAFAVLLCSAMAAFAVQAWILGGIFIGCCIGSLALIIPALKAEGARGAASK